MFSLPIPALFAVSIAASWMLSVIRGVYSKSYGSDHVRLWLFNCLQNSFCLAGVLLIFAFSGGIGSFSVFSVVLGVLLGILNVFSLNANLKALNSGPFSYTTILCSVLTVIIPTLSGLFWGESISPAQYAGIVLMLVCIVLSPAESSGAEEKKASLKWLLLCVFSGVQGGLTGVIQKVHQSSRDHSAEMAAMLVCAFATAGVIAAIEWAAAAKKEAAPAARKEKAPITVWLYPVLAGLGFAIPNAINLYLAGKVDSAIMFPLVNLCPMILSMITAMILFKERLTKKRWAGIVIGVIAMVFLSGIL